VSSNRAPGRRLFVRRSRTGAGIAANVSTTLRSDMTCSRRSKFAMAEKDAI
jgi:hypothetical protein